MNELPNCEKHHSRQLTKQTIDLQIPLSAKAENGILYLIFFLSVVSLKQDHQEKTCFISYDKSTFSLSCIIL